MNRPVEQRSSISAQSIEQLYQQTFPVIRSKCGRMLGDASEGQDVAQETFARLWSERHRIADPEALVAWVYRTSTRLAVDRIRRGARVGLASDGEWVGNAGIDRRDPEQLAGWRELARAADSVPKKELEAAILCRLDGLTQPEAARVMGKSERSVRRLLARLDRRLAKLGGGQ